jgi:glycosidase
MKLILDLVINHTSDQHAWFKESRSSKDNPKRDWYIWKPPRYAEDGTRLPPTNWRSYFSGPAWEYDEHTGEYYLHLFAKEQPDLNWENEETREAIYNSAMRFWLDKGVDGFRVDVVNMYSKGVEFKDAPVVDSRFHEQPAWMYYANGPRMHEFLREMNQKVLNHYGDTVTVGELPHTPDPKKVLQYVGASDKQLSMVFQFDIVDIGQGREHKYHFQEWKLPLLKGIVAKWQQFIEGTDGWTTVFCENHGMLSLGHHHPLHVVVLLINRATDMINRPRPLGIALRLRLPRAPRALGQAALAHALRPDRHAVHLPGPGDRHDQRAPFVAHRRVPRHRVGQLLQGHGAPDQQRPGRDGVRHARSADPGARQRPPPDAVDRRRAACRVYRL